MSLNKNFGTPARQRNLSVAVACTTLLIAPVSGTAEILWSGNYETGDFTQWHKPDSWDDVAFHEVPEYGRPVQYGGQLASHVGNGELLSLVTGRDDLVDNVFYERGPTRYSRYAAKFTVKNSVNGSEPRDCDGDVCRRRRTELTVQRTLPNLYDALGYTTERWLSISHYLPSDWDDGGSGWGTLVFQVKPKLDGGGIGPCLAIGVANGSWTIRHAWTDVEDLREEIPWRQRPIYTATYPAADGSDNGADLRADFPDQPGSQAALGDLNKGGWTDWIMHVKFDARGSADGGKGFLRIWKRAGDDDWIEVLHVMPKKITIEGQTYDRGVCFNSPDGFGVKAGMYMDKSQVWNLADNRVLYNDNIKVGSASSTFAEMSPDNSSPGSPGSGGGGDPASATPPKPPQVIVDNPAN